MNLFRKNVTTKNRSLKGDVVIATPLQLRFYGIFVVVIVLASLLYLSFSTYTREEKVSGWLVPQGGIIRVTAKSATKQTGMEYVVQARNGALMTIVQGDEHPFSEGQKVIVLYGARSRIIADKSAK